MKRMLVILLSVMLLISALPLSAGAEAGDSPFRLIPQEHRDGETYWKIGDFYFVDLNLYDEGVGEGEGTSEHYLVKTDEPYASGDEEFETVVLNFHELAKEIGNYDQSSIIAYSSVLSDGHELYAVVNAVSVSDADPIGDYENVIVKVNLENLSHEIFRLKGNAGNMPVLGKMYKNNLYFGANFDLLYRLSAGGKVTKTTSGLGELSTQQSDSGSRFIYTALPRGYYETLKVFDAEKKSTVRTVSGVRGFFATKTKLYYAKKEKSVLKVYEAKASGASPKLIYKLTNKSGLEYRLAKVDKKNIYLTSVDTKKDYKRTYYRYDRSSKKLRKITYVKYAEATYDYIDGFEPIDEYYSSLNADDKGAE